MKKTLSIILSAAVLLSYAAISASADGDEAKVTYEAKQVAVSPMDGGENTEFTCLFRSDLPEVPFVNVEDFFDQIFTIDGKPESLGSGVYKYTNGDYNMTADAEKDTISFDFLEGFLSSNRTLEGMPGYTYVENGDGYELTGEIKGLDFDLSKYDLDIVENDGSIYLPFCTLNDMFLEAGVAMRYKNEKITMANSMNVMGAKGSFDDTRSKEYAKFSYDELCFTLDCLCGRPSNAILTDSIINGGLDKALDSYDSVTPRVKELLLSENTEEYCMGLAFLQYYMNDGGHTELTYSLTDRLSYIGVKDLSSLVKKAFGDEENDDIKKIMAEDDKEALSHEKLNKLAVAKSDAYKSFEKIKEWQGAVLCKSGDTYFFNFTSFDNEIVPIFKEAMDYAQEHGAKNFIVDVTLNGGGDDVAAAYLIALMCDTYSFSEKYIASGNQVRFNGRIDKNLDGKFDEEDDKLKYDFRCAVIASAGSYSCANIFPCMAQDHGICLIGEKTAGGSCAVVPRLYANGTGYNCSGYMMYLREEGKDADAGAEPDVKMPGMDYDYKGFYDVEAINKGIAEFYGEPIPQDEGIYGDVDGDSKVSAKDSMAIQRYTINLTTFGDAQLKAADIDGDGKATSKDAMNILRFTVNLTVKYPIGEKIAAEETAMVTYYFLAPDEFIGTNQKVGVYYWQPKENAPWPGVEMTPAPEIGKNVFSCSVPDNEKTETLIFNSFVDAGSPADPELIGDVYQTVNISLCGYIPEDESELYDTLDDFYGMIYVIRPEENTLSEYQGNILRHGEWFSVNPDDYNYYKNYPDYYGTYGFE